MPATVGALAPAVVETPGPAAGLASGLHVEESERVGHQHI